MVSTKLIQDKLLVLLGSREAKNLQDNNNQDDNYIKLPSVKGNKRPKTEATKGELVNSKLLIALIKFALKIRQDIRAKKILTLNTS